MVSFFGTKRKKSNATMADSTSKRRKVKAVKKTPGVPPWPTRLLPVEIFTLVATHLPRSSIQNLRLVNKEFEEKVSEYLFRAVVVPFNPQIYGIAAKLPSPNEVLVDTDCKLPPGAVMLQDMGMRVFEGFGTRIRRFAMSFEFDADKLASPPVKSDQEAITTFWGIYRWPYKGYNRYSQLEGLEETADETRTMAKAFRFIKRATELGLSIDGGLGWLAGPDTNYRVVQRGGEKLSVFGENQFVPEPNPSYVTGGKPAKSPASHRRDTMYETYERMLVEAGYSGESLTPAIRLMIESEEPLDLGTAFTARYDEISHTLSLRNLRRLKTLPRSIEQGTLELIALLEADPDDEAQHAPSDDDPPLVPNWYRSSTRGVELAKEKVVHHSLKPNDLTTAQKEMLLETEWAQSAFMQSYAIAVIDNPFTFKDITTLTIARLPYRHLNILRRNDFWGSLAQLKSLSLAIIPDWRELVKLPTSYVQDHKLLPSQSVHGVYLLLREQISNRKSVKSLHFEWLCGGEYSPGMFSRNQHILPAPLTSTAVEMVDRMLSPEVLNFPFVEHLSLKNCWVSPHAMYTFLHGLKRAHLESITFESVSLTAPIPQYAQPTQLPGNNLPANPPANVLFPIVQNPTAGNQMAPGPVLGPPIFPLPPVAPPVEAMDWLNPREGSWSRIIDFMSPGATLAGLRYFYDLGPEPDRPSPTNITRLEFKTCGYLRLPLSFDQTVLGTDEGQSANQTRYTELEPYMLKSNDPYLGTIINYMSPLEQATLDNAWDMTTSWGSSRSALAAECRSDGITTPGDGRFDGIVEPLGD